MNKEEITYKIPNNQIHISEIKDEDCLIWISPKALYMANTIDKLLQENKKYKEVIDKVSSQIKLYGKYNGEKCTRGFSMMTADFNKLLDILKEVNNETK